MWLLRDGKKKISFCLSVCVCVASKGRTPEELFLEHNTKGGLLWLRERCFCFFFKKKNKNNTASPLLTGLFCKQQNGACFVFVSCFLQFDGRQLFSSPPATRLQKHSTVVQICGETKASSQGSRINKLHTCVDTVL